jgi:hypothetical protein
VYEPHKIKQKAINCVTAWREKDARTRMESAGKLLEIIQIYDEDDVPFKSIYYRGGSAPVTRDAQLKTFRMGRLREAVKVYNSNRRIIGDILKFAEGVAEGRVPMGLGGPLTFRFSGEEKPCSVNIANRLNAARGQMEALNNRVLVYLLAHVNRDKINNFSKLSGSFSFAPFVHSSTDWRAGATSITLSTTFSKLIRSESSLQTLKTASPPPPPDDAEAGAGAGAAVAEAAPVDDDVVRFLNEHVETADPDDIAEMARVVLNKHCDAEAAIVDPMANLPSTARMVAPRRNRRSSRRKQRGGYKYSFRNSPFELNVEKFKIIKENNPKLADTLIFHALTDAMVENIHDAEDFRNYAFEFLRDSGAGPDPCTLCWLFDKWVNDKNAAAERGGGG